MKETFRTEKELSEGTPPDGHRNRFLDRLEKEEKKPTTVRWMPWLFGISSAAVALWAIFTISFSSPGEISTTAEDGYNPIEALEDRSNHLENVYSQHVKPRIPAVLKNQPELKEQIDLLDQLDKEYAKLKTLFIKTEGNESITKEMLRNHRIRLQIMEQMLHQIELLKTKKSHKNEIKSA